MRFLLGCLLLIILAACSTQRATPIVSYRVETPTKDEIVAIDIDANGYVTRRLHDNTDEFQLAPTDFALILDQLRAADLPNMHLTNALAGDTGATIIHTISTPETQVRFVDAATPESVKPLIVSFQRVMGVALPAAAAP